MGLLKLLPGDLGEMEGLLSKVPPRRSSDNLPLVTPAVGDQTARVGVLLGCVMDVLCGPENEATVRVLARNGCEVVAPDSGCCGALHAHAGDLPRARRLAKQVIRTFEQAEVEAIVLNSAGCGAAMRDYGHWFHDDPLWAERAAALSAKVVDLTEWLATHGLSPQGLQGMEQRVTYHDACHLNHAQGVNAPPREVLAAIPGIDLVELPEAGWCCGSAGIYNITHFAEAVQLLDRKMANVKRTGAQVVVTGNPGCLLQLRYGVRRAGLEVEALHTATLLDRAYGGKG
jgi:glycolate oxidase iron-sulfur subunit